MTSDGGAPGGFRVDEADAFGARVARHLREDVVVWLTTVGPSGAPSPNPVWFVWDGAASVLVYNLPDAARVGHLAANPHVALNFDGDAVGGDIVVLAGYAEVRPDEPPCDALPQYQAKYAAHIARIGLTPVTFARRYSVPVRVTLRRVRGH